MLVGIAIDEGRIRSVDDLAAASCPSRRHRVRRTSLRHLLQMSSGVRFNEALTRWASPATMSFSSVLDTYMRVGPGGVGAVTSFNDRERPAGTKFSYASVETQVLGPCWRAQRSAGRRVPGAEDLAPMGAEADATWLIDNSGQEVTCCCLNAVLRDYARLRLLLAHDVTWRDLPEASTAQWFKGQVRWTPSARWARCWSPPTRSPIPRR